MAGPGVNVMGSFQGCMDAVDSAVHTKQLQQQSANSIITWDAPTDGTFRRPHRMIPSSLENKKREEKKTKNPETSDDTRFMLFNVPPKGVTRT